jgi:PKD repeat protein
MRISFVLLSVLFSVHVIAQTEQSHAHEAIPCHNNLEQKLFLQSHPEYIDQIEQEQAEFQTFYEHYLATEFDPNDRASYTIPIVFHVVHQGGIENISEEQIFDALEKLNEDYSGANSDLANVVTDFTAVIGNPDIEFRLATKDINGECHPGITRTFSTNTIHDGDDDVWQDVQAEHGSWPQNRYLNIFVVADPSGAAGYTNYPSGWYPENGMEGAIYLRHDYCGTIGTGTEGRRRTISHECAHWLNIAHCWGNSNSPGEAGNCSEDDGVVDTPNSIGWNGCDLDGESCGAGVNNVQNNMEYTGSCRRMFTQGQAARMHTALNSGLAGRNNLWIGTNLTATGTNGPGDLCEAKFSATTQTICAGQTVTFQDNSYHTITTRTWTFEGGTPATSTAESPIVTYNAAGAYAVSLAVSDGTNNEVITKSSYVSVFSAPGFTLPYSEGFESLTLVPDGVNWITVDENESSFELVNVGSQGSTKSARLLNFGNDDETADELVSATIDLSSVDPSEEVILTFDYAYRKRNSSNDEWLKFYISNDCGETWVLRKNIHDNDLSPMVVTSSYSPGAADWYQVEINNISSTYYVEDFRFKFRFENNDGNNFYVDNINLYPLAELSIDEQVGFEVSLSPNPSLSTTNLLFENTISEYIEVELISLEGKLIKKVYQGSGVSSIEINTSELSPGLYFVRIKGDDRLQTLKLQKM